MCDNRPTSRNPESSGGLALWSFPPMDLRFAKASRCVSGSSRKFVGKEPREREWKGESVTRWRPAGTRGGGSKVVPAARPPTPAGVASAIGILASNLFCWISPISCCFPVRYVFKGVDFTHEFFILLNRQNSLLLPNEIARQFWA